MHHGWGIGSRVAPRVGRDRRRRLPRPGLIDGRAGTGEQDQALAEAALSDAVTAGTLTHGNEPELLTAVGAAVWQQAGAQRRLVSSGTIDVTPIKAAALAVHAASQMADPLQQVW
jgi:hypothetical protein